MKEKLIELSKTKYDKQAVADIDDIDTKSISATSSTSADGASGSDNSNAKVSSPTTSSMRSQASTTVLSSINSRTASAAKIGSQPAKKKNVRRQAQAVIAPAVAAANDRRSVFWETYGHLVSRYVCLFIGATIFIVTAVVGGLMIDEHNRTHY